MNCAFDDNVEPGDYVIVGLNGILQVSRFGDMVIGTAYKSFTTDRTRKNLYLDECPPFKLEGYWKRVDGNLQQFYLDKYNPTNKFKRFKYKTLDSGVTVPHFIEQLKCYTGDKYIITFDNEGIYVEWIEQWEE